MIDIHCHILHGLDDGAGSLEMSTAMAEIAIASGTTALVATPHSDLRYRYDPDLAESRIAELRRLFEGRLTLARGCDFHLSFENLRDALRRPDRYTINSGRYLLVEFPDARIVSNATDLLRTLINAGLIPVITHPERNPVLRQRAALLDAWVEDGCLLQVTGSALLGAFGSSAKTSAERLMEKGLVHFLASDGHDDKRRPPELAKAFAFVADRWGMQAAERLCKTNPLAALENRDIVRDVRTSARGLRKWLPGLLQ